ncbi:MAG: excinuclease ABC subunit UvrC [Acidiferrobacteraceae bacterium]
MLKSHREFLKSLSSAPGVYRMMDASGEVLYVGKARNLRRRVTSYFRKSALDTKSQALVAAVVRIETTVTHTENEALLLEHNLIKTLKPRYNILLRDDKSYPYIYISLEQEFPRLGFHRGAKMAPGRYFGPFPNSLAVRESLNLMQKVFLLRDCEDTVFRNRSRPCLHYQIHRCSAPCVGFVAKEAYRQDVRHAEMFLNGRSSSVVDELARLMEAASLRHDYEEAAVLRDRIAALRQIQERQYVSAEEGEADVLSVASGAGVVCVEMMCIRGGRNLGSRAFFPNIGIEHQPQEILGQFVARHYLEYPPPDHIYLDRRIEGQALLQEVLSERSGRRVALSVPVRGLKQRWIKMASINAEDELRRRLAARTTLEDRFDALSEALELDQRVERIECFDISHTQGEATVASNVSFDRAGPVKSDYRRYNIEGTDGDDYEALRQTVRRRYARMKPEAGKRPDIVLIDGGRGQLNAVLEAAREVGAEDLLFIGVAKGPGRRPGDEELILADRDGALRLPADAPALHLIQSVRDEAHRFAISGHRRRRDKQRVTSELERIPGVGQKRRQALLRHLGGLRFVARAGIEDLAKVPGISPDLAKRIYDTFHEGIA